MSLPPAGRPPSPSRRDHCTCRTAPRSSPPWQPPRSTRPGWPVRSPRPSPPPGYPRRAPRPDNDLRIPPRNSGARWSPRSPWSPRPSSPRRTASPGADRWRRSFSRSPAARRLPSRCPLPRRPSPWPPPWPPLSPPQRAGRPAPPRPRRRPLPRPPLRPRSPPRDPPALWAQWAAPRPRSSDNSPRNHNWPYSLHNRPGYPPWKGSGARTARHNTPPGTEPPPHRASAWTPWHRGRTAPSGSSSPWCCSRKPLSPGTPCTWRNLRRYRRQSPPPLPPPAGSCS